MAQSDDRAILLLDKCAMIDHSQAEYVICA